MLREGDANSSVMQRLVIQVENLSIGFPSGVNHCEIVALALLTGAFTACKTKHPSKRVSRKL